MHCTWALRIGWICLMHAALAEDLVTLDGRTFREATARRLDDDRLLLQHAEGQTHCSSSKSPNRCGDAWASTPRPP